MLELGIWSFIRYNTARSMQKSSPEKLDMHSEEFLHSLMRKQLRLSIACAAMFLIALLGLPLANYFFPDVMATRVFGFTLTWFILGVLFFPLVRIISYVFIKRSIFLEEEEAAAAGEATGEGGQVGKGQQREGAEGKRGSGEKEQAVCA